MACTHNGDPARLLRRLNERGGVARLVGALLAHGIDEAGDWDTGRLNRHLAALDSHNALGLSKEVLRVAVDEPAYDPVTMAMIDAALDSCSQRDAAPLAAWVAGYADEVTG